MESSESNLNPLHKQHLLTTFQYVDKLLSDIERVLTSSDSVSPFPSHVNDVTPIQRKLMLDYVGRVRTQIVRAMEGQGIEMPPPRFSMLHVIRTTLTFIDIAIEEMRPKYLKGYGEVPVPSAVQMEGLVEEMESLIERFQAAIQVSEGKDFEARIRALGHNNIDTELLQLLGRIITERGLVEFRTRLNAIISRLEDRRFEIALFGRVSSGKSSLLNALLDESVLPVGVTPITAVPTRITYGASRAVQVWFASGPAEKCDIEDLAKFVAEQQNPGNRKHVTRVLVTVPSKRLREGVVFVDTPGLGSLATSGAAETIAYLPQCDLGVVLVDAGATLTEEDLATIRLLHDAGIESQVVVSKGDLLSESDTGRLIKYVRQHIGSELGLQPPITAVSSKDEHRELLERWFTGHILPLYEQSADRARTSLWKKTLLMKETVEATLRVKAQRLAQKHAPANIIEMEKALRSAAAEIVKCRKECEDWTRDFPDRADRLLSDLARTIAATLKNKDGDSNIEHFIEAAVAEAVRDMQRRIDSVVDTLVSALNEVAKGLQLTPPNRDEFTAHVRNMPRFDAPTVDVRLGSSLAMLGLRIAEMKIRGNLHKNIGKPLGDALYSYSGQLETWSRNVLRNIEHQFESHADIYSGQLSALGPQQTVSSDDIEQLQLDLASLEGWKLQAVS